MSFNFVYQIVIYSRNIIIIHIFLFLNSIKIVYVLCQANIMIFINKQICSLAHGISSN